MEWKSNVLNWIVEHGRLPLRVVGEDPLGRVAPRHLVPPLDGARRAPLAARRRRPRRRHGRRAHVVVPRGPPGDGHGRRRHRHHALHAPAVRVGVTLSQVSRRLANMKIHLALTPNLTYRERTKEN